MAAVPINYWAILVASIAKFFIGFVWFTFLFGKQWAALQKMGPEMMGNKQVMTRGMIIDFVVGLVLAWVLVHVIRWGGANDWLLGVKMGAFTWLGFIGVTTLSGNTWENRPVALWLINNGYLLLSLVAMSVILALWV